MDAFKYRTLSDDGFKYAIDIIKNKRLYCAEWHALNDPMEGYFHAVSSSREEQQNIRNMANQIISKKSDYRICSLSKVNNSPLMWAYYADGFRGVAIGVDIKKRISRIEDVEYNDGHNLGEYDPGESPDLLARKFFLTKNRAWKHEQEIRIILDKNDKDAFFDLDHEPNSVHMGVNISRQHRDELETICASHDIALYEMNLKGFKIGFSEVNISKPTPMGF